MVAAVRAVPGMRATFNLVPSLVEQVEAYADERTWDRHLVLGLADAETVAAADAAWFVREAFHAHAPTMIVPYPRYAELATQALREAPVHRRRPARPAGVAEAGLDRSRGAGGRPAGAAAGGEGPRLRRSRQAGAARPRARAAAPGGAGLSRGRRRRRRRALHLAVLPPDPAVGVRLGGAPCRASGRHAAAAAVPASRGRGAAAAAGRDRRIERWFGVPPAGRLALRGQRVGSCGGGGGARRFPVDGQRRGDPGAIPVAGAAPRRRPLPAARAGDAGRGSPRALPGPRACPTGSGSPIRAGGPRTRWPTSSPGCARPAGSPPRMGSSTRWCRSSSTARTPGSTIRPAAGRSFASSTVDWSPPSTSSRSR